MLENLDVFRMARALAGHAGTRQAVIARNIANADTPGYRARDTAPFASTYRDQGNGPALRTTRGGHLDAVQPNYRASVMAGSRLAAGSPNGNTVSLETEMTRSAEARHQHDLALAVYRSSLNVLRASLGRN